MISFMWWVFHVTIAAETSARAAAWVAGPAVAAYPGFPDELSIDLNAPDLTVLTGAEDAIEQARAELAEQGVKARRLHTSHAFHSASMEAAMAPLAACAASIERRPPRLRIASNVSGDWLTDEEAVDPAYWARQLRSPVRFGDGVGALLSSGVTALLEIGPGGTLTQLARRHPAWSEQHTLARSLPDHAEGGDLDRETMLTALGRLWTAGVQPRWGALHQGARRRIVVLPTYPFERARHWIDPAPLPDAAGAAAPGPFTPAGPLASPPAAAPSPPPAPPAPADAASRVAAVFESLLGVGVGGVGGQDDFFDLGGSSLIGVDLVARLRDVLGVDLPLGAVFRNPRPDDIAALAAGAANGSPEPEGTGDLARADIWIPGDVGCTRSLRPARSRPDDVLLTGATGFLGSFLLRELLDQATGRVHCLVRADDPELGLERLRRGLGFYDLLDGADLDRVVVVPGDLSRDRLGLEIERYEELSATVGSVLHNGAKVSFLEPYGLLRRTNVRGTREVLRLASHGALKPVGHVSSIAVFDCDALEDVRVAHEDDDLTGAAGFHGGYDESKWVSEQVVELARRRGVPVTIYRPGNIAGDSRSSAVSDGHLVSAMLKGCIALGVAPDTDELVDVVPVDYVSRALVALSRSEESPNRTFHLVNPTATRWNEIVGHLNAVGYEVSLVPPEEWRAAIRTEAHEDNPLRVFLPMLEERALFSGRRYRCERTVEALSGTGIVCPPLDASLIATYVRALVARGELGPPGHASEPLAPVGSGRA
jgi:phthiocerol/phenolphthiocerol synthesis type-I polyketide synthase E